MTYAANLVAACQSVADALTGAGVPATLSRSKLRVPGAWVRPDTTSGRATLGGSHQTGTARVSVLLVAPQAGDEEALADLAGLLDLALTVIDPDDDVDTTVVLPLNSNPLPAFRLVVDVDL